MDSAQITVLFDGDCPLCSREVEMLRRRDRGRGQIDFEDIAAPDFDPGVYGLDAGTVMARIHGVLPGGQVIEGMEVFTKTSTVLRCCGAHGHFRQTQAKFN